MAPRVTQETVDRMVELYRGGMRITAIAATCGVSWPTVCNHLRPLGVMPPPEARVGVRRVDLDPALVVEAICAYRQATLSIHGVATLLGVSYSTAREVLMDHEVPLRRQGPASHINGRP